MALARMAILHARWELGVFILQVGYILNACLFSLFIIN